MSRTGLERGVFLKGGGAQSLLGGKGVPASSYSTWADPGSRYQTPGSRKSAFVTLLTGPSWISLGAEDSCQLRVKEREINSARRCIHDH